MSVTAKKIIRKKQFTVKAEGTKRNCRGFSDPWAF